MQEGNSFFGARAVIRVLLTLIALINLSACAKQMDFSEKLAPENPPPDNPSFEIGGMAQFENLNQTSRERTHFGNFYDRMDLEAVLSASGRSTVEYIRSLGVDIYRIPQQGSTHHPIYFVNLLTPPQIFDSVWKNKASTTEGTLMGVYFDACGHPVFGDCDQSKVVNPVILVAEQSDRWTLIHELLHFSFDSQRRSSGAPIAPELESQINLILEALKEADNTYTASPNKSDLFKIAQFTQRLIEATYRLMTMRYLEEMAVEYILIDEWYNGRLNNISPLSVKNALWYMNHGRTQSLTHLTHHLPTIVRIEQEARKYDWDDVLAQTELARETLNDIQTTTTEMVERAENLTGYQVPMIYAQAHQSPPPSKPPAKACLGNDEDHEHWQDTLEVLNSLSLGDGN